MQAKLVALWHDTISALLLAYRFSIERKVTGDAENFGFVRAGVEVNADSFCANPHPLKPKIYSAASKRLLKRLE